MTGFIAQTAGGENPVGSTLVQHALRGRPAAVRDHPGHQHHQHRDRPSLQAGLLMSIATATAREVTAGTIATGRSRDRTPGRWSSSAPVVLAVLRRHGAARADRRHRDRRRPRASTRSCSPTTTPRISPEQTGFRAGILGSLWLMVFTALFAVPLGIAAALYLEEFADTRALVQPPHRGQPAEPRRRPVHRLRPARRRRHGADRASSDTGIVLGGAIALALLILPVIIITTREAVRAVPQEIRHGSLALGPPCGRPPGGRPCPRRSPASPPAPSSASPGRSARRRR